MIKWNYDINEKIVYANYTDNIQLDDVLSFFSELCESRDTLPAFLRIFQDETCAHFINSNEIIKYAIKATEKLTSNYEHVKVAILQYNTIKTAYSFYFLELLNNDLYEAKVFSTKEAAMDWLKF